MAETLLKLLQVVQTSERGCEWEVSVRDYLVVGGFAAHRALETHTHDTAHPPPHLRFAASADSLRIISVVSVVRSDIYTGLQVGLPRNRNRPTLTWRCCPSFAFP
jgi:hypothetical protein